MKVAHVHRIAGIGGSERHLLTLLPALSERDVEVRFVGLDVSGQASDPFYRELAARGVPAVRLPSRGDVDPLLALRLPRLLRRLRPDVVHTHLVHADVYGALATVGSPFALVSTKHNDDPFRAGPFRLVERALARRADAVVAITDSVRRFAIDNIGLPAAKIATIHYGLDEPPPPWNGDVADAPSGRMLLGVGRLVEQKGYDTLVRALPAIRAAHPDVVLVVVGEGPLRRELMRLAADLGVADALHLPGRSGDVAAWMRRAEVFVHPSRWEGFGLVVLEAMLLGLPIVATRVSALPELIEHPVSGILVEPGNDATLAAAAIELLGDASRRTTLGAAAQQRARTAFSVARMADATVALYRRVAAATSPAAQESAV